MDFMQLKIKMIFLKTLCVLSFSLTYVITAHPEYTVHEGSVKYSGVKPNFILYEHQDRQRRDASSEVVSSTEPGLNSTGSTDGIKYNALPNITADVNKITKVAEARTSVPFSGFFVVVTKAVLGVNRSDILQVNLISNRPKVRVPILPNDNTDNIFKKTIKAEKNLTALSNDSHDFYNSSIIANVTYFQEYWANITKPKSEVHGGLSNSHRRAFRFKLSFDFPFYGHDVRNIIVANGGFIYTGDRVHNWLAATQYIAPLMANFDTTHTNDSIVHISDDGEKFSVFWENATLQEDHTKKFTFAVTLYKNGDIVFAYKDVPIPVQKINNVEHPVKVGISDAYDTYKYFFEVRRKTIYEYHRVSLLSHEITNNTILKLVATTCLQYKSCTDCLNDKTGLKCVWRDQLGKCSSGIDSSQLDRTTIESWNDRNMCLRAVETEDH